MIKVNDEIKNAYNSSTTQVDKIVVEGNEYRITNVVYSDDCYLDGNIFGTAIARTLEFDIENNIDLEKKEVEYWTGVYVNGSIEWFCLGKFIVDDVEPNDISEISKVRAMDYMLKASTVYETHLNYGYVTILDVIKEVCTNCGLKLGTTDFANSDFVVDSNQFDEGTLNVQVIQAVAQISGTFAKIKSDNKLYFITPTQTYLTVEEVNSLTVQGLNELPVEKLFIDHDKVKELTKNDYEKLILKRNTHPINIVSLGMADVEGENIVIRDEESVQEHGENALVINDNPFAYTQEKREKLILALFEKVKGFSYTAFEITGQSKPFVETGDELIVVDMHGVCYRTFMFRFNYNSPDSLESEMSAPSIIKATVQYQNVLNALEKNKLTEWRVDKANQTISGLVEDMYGETGKISQVIQSVDSWSTKVAEIMDLTDTKSDIKKIEISDGAKSNLIELRIKGNNVVFESKYFDDDVYVSEDTYLGGDSKICVNNVIYELGIEDVLRQKAVTTTDADGKEQIINYYDEYIYSYVDETSQVIRRINPETNYPYVLEGKTERIEELTYFDIPFEEGINVVEIVNYSANFSISYLQKNDYTSYFVSNLQLEGELQVSKDEILGEVSETYTTKDETKQVKSQISQKASSVLIDVTNGETTASIRVALEDENGNVLDSKVGTIDMTGIVSFNDLAGEGRTEINGANITTGTISAERLDTSTINSVNGTIGGFKITEVGLQAEGVLIASDGGTIFTNLHTVYEGTEYADLPTTKSYSVDSSATIRHINLIGDGTAMNVAGYTKNFNLYASQSDPQLKKNIKETEVNGLDFINEIEHIEFNWKSNDKFQANGYNAKQLGEICEDFVIAVEQPEGAEYSEILQVRDFNMMPYITKAIQELDKKIKELQEENRILKNMIKGVDVNE